eukprot:scaffold43747_cov47-Phaeocystis_antarctica.AAC.1
MPLALSRDLGGPQALKQHASALGATLLLCWELIRRGPCSKGIRDPVLLSSPRRHSPSPHQADPHPHPSPSPGRCRERPSCACVRPTWRVAAARGGVRSCYACCSHAPRCWRAMCDAPAPLTLPPPLTLLPPSPGYRAPLAYLTLLPPPLPRHPHPPHLPTTTTTPPQGARGPVRAAAQAVLPPARAAARGRRHSTAAAADRPRCATASLGGADPHPHRSPLTAHPNPNPNPNPNPGPHPNPHPDH